MSTKIPSYRTSTPDFDGSALAMVSSGEMTLVTTATNYTASAFMCPWNSVIQRAYIYNRVACSTASLITLAIGTVATNSKYYYNASFAGGKGSMSIAGGMQIIENTATTWTTTTVTAGDTIAFTVPQTAGIATGVVAVTLVLNPNI